MKNIDIENAFSLLLFNASPDCEKMSIPLVGDVPTSVIFKDGDLFLGNYNEDNCHYYGYYVRTDKTGDFHKVKKPFILPVGNVTELQYDKEKDKEDKSDEEPKLKVPYSALPWYIGVFHWIKSELGFRAAKLFKDEFLNGIEEYQIQSDEVSE